MNNLQTIDKKHLLVRPEEYLKDKSQLPPHISFDEYRKLRESIYSYWERKQKFSQNYQFIANRDLLLIDYMFETGGRIGDIINIAYKDYTGNQLNLYTKKRKKSIVIDVSDALIKDTLTFLRKFNINDNEKIFDITIQRTWQIVKQYANNIDFPKMIKTWENGKNVETTLRPHLFRHGMAIHLLNQGVRIEIISSRLGHSNIKITQDMYLKITPEIQHIHLQNVQWR